jgi:hypothetical protein
LLQGHYQALAGGGEMELASNGSVALTQALAVVTNTTLDAKGGAIFQASGQMELSNSAVVSNRVDAGSMSLGCCTLPSYAGTAFGGGIFQGGALRMVNVTVAENTAAGGSTYNYDAQPGSGLGGGIYSAGTATLLNVTEGLNVAAAGTSVNNKVRSFSWGDSLMTETNAVSLSNTILLTVTTNGNVHGTVIDGGHNISSDASATFTATSSRNSLNPLLGPVADNGGSTLTMALLPASPAIDAADDFMCPPTDQRGVQRPMAYHCDIGTFELAPALTLLRGPLGVVTLTYAFQAGVTNLVEATLDSAPGPSSAPALPTRTVSSNSRIRQQPK